MGIVGAALTGFAQGTATGYVQNIEAEIEALKQDTILERREAMRVKGRQSDADFETKQRSTAGTKQFDEAEASKRKKDADEIALRTARNKETEGLIQSGADHAQTASGDHLVRGDDGKVRRTDKDGNLLDGKGVDAKTFGMDAKDKIELSTAELRNTAAKLAVADHGKDKTKAKELENAYATYGFYLRNKAKNPKGNYDEQIDAEAARIMGLGGDPEKMAAQILGAVEKSTVTVKDTDVETGRETSTSKVVSSRPRTDAEKSFAPLGGKPEIRKDKSGNYWTKDANGKVVPYKGAV